MINKWRCPLYYCLIIILSNFLLASEQVKDLKAIHNSGQTFITWQEVSLVPTIPEKITTTKLSKLQLKFEEEKKVRYKIYKSKSPIKRISSLKPVAEVPPFTCWNVDRYYITYEENDLSRYVIEEGKEPLKSGTGIFVNTFTENGDAYYSVTVSVDGKENLEVTEENSLQTPICETVGAGVPILQRIEKHKEFFYIKSPTLYYFIRWEVPPNCNVKGRSFDYLVVVPKDVTYPAPVGINLHYWGADLNKGYFWYDQQRKEIILSPNQNPYDWWTGYHEEYNIKTNKPLKVKEDCLKGKVYPYTQRRILSFLDWLPTRWNIDKKRVFIAGSSMGGSGSAMFAIRYPEVFAWTASRVGIHIPEKSPGFKSSYERVWGPREWDVKFENGTSVWDYYNDVLYLRKYPNKEIGFIAFANGKNDESIGWPQAVEFFKALQDTKRPHLFAWGMKGHNEQVLLPKGGGRKTIPDISIDQSLPAFTHCSLDDNPGNGDTKDGVSSGQVNLYLYWETEGIVDEVDKWEMRVGLINNAQKDSCTVDLTPRRLQKFKIKPMEAFKWKNISLKDKKEIQSGTVIADKYGLVTVEKLIVEKGDGNRIKIFK